MSLISTNPATDEKIREFSLMSEREVYSCIEAAHQAYLQWRKTDFSHRAALMKKAAQLLREKNEEYAQIITQEMGKPISASRKEIAKCAWVCDYYSDKTAEFLSQEPIATDAQKSFVTFQPLGVILSIMPWNFPFWQVFRFAAPALMAGNAGVLKHAANVSLCALKIEEIFSKAGFPSGLFQTLLINTGAVSSVIENPYVKAVTLTGSTRAGKAVAQQAGQALKKTVLELGGSDPYVVLEDADLPATVETCVTSRMINSGQSCIAAKRFIVVESLRPQFEEMFVTEMKKYKMGDPTQEDVTVGPQARKDLRESLHQQVEKTLAQGAKCLLGGKIPQSKGAFYPPTVLTNVQRGMPAYEEEVFGPVAAIIPVADEKQAIETANNSCFGLGAAVFTKDVAKGEKIAAYELEAGCCFVNDFVKSDPRLPFGGIKGSGYGRELSYYGIKEFVNIKTVYVK